MMRPVNGVGIVRADVVWDANGTETRNEHLYWTGKCFTFGRDGTGIMSPHPIMKRTGRDGNHLCRRCATGKERKTESFTDRTGNKFAIFERDGNEILFFLPLLRCFLSHANGLTRLSTGTIEQ